MYYFLIINKKIQNVNRVIYARFLKKLAKTETRANFKKIAAESTTKISRRSPAAVHFQQRSVQVRIGKQKKRGARNFVRANHFFAA